MIGRHFGEDLDEDGTEQPCHFLGSAGVYEQLQYAAKEGQIGNERKQQIENRVFGGGQDAIGGLLA